MIGGLDPQKIKGLGRDLASPHIALRFLTDFLNMLPQRLGRIQSAIDAHDNEDAMDAVLSLKVTAAMTGAVEAEGCCLDLQSSIRTFDFYLATGQVQNLAVIVARLNNATPVIIEHVREALGLDEDVVAFGCAAA